MKNTGKILVLISFFMILVMFTGAVSAANWTVNPGDSIQSTVDNAFDNDTIIVNDNNGTAYTYTVNLAINKKLQLQAKTGVNVTLQALNPSSPVITVNSLGNGTKIQGFTINGATSSDGIYLDSAYNCFITENNILNNGNGIYLSYTNNNTITGNTVINNWNNNGGVYLFYSDRNTISGNNIIDNWDGIYLEYSNTNTIFGNTIKYNNEGVYFDSSDNNTISGNNITDNCDSGIYFEYSNTNTISGNSITNNCDSGIYLYCSSTNINFNRIFGNIFRGL